MTAAAVRAAVGAIPGAREVSYEDWTSAQPAGRGLILAGGESVFYVYDTAPAPAVHALPTEPGAVVLGATVNAVKPRPMILGHAGPADKRLQWLEWCYVDDDGDPASTETPDDDWLPARVVPDDDEGPVAALRWIAEHQMPAMSLHEQIGALRFKARQALARLEGGAS